MSATVADLDAARLSGLEAGRRWWGRTDGDEANPYDETTQYALFLAWETEWMGFDGGGDEGTVNRPQQ